MYHKRATSADIQQQKYYDYTILTKIHTTSSSHIHTLQSRFPSDSSHPPPPLFSHLLHFRSPSLPPCLSSPLPLSPSPPPTIPIYPISALSSLLSFAIDQETQSFTDQTQKSLPCGAAVEGMDRAREEVPFEGPQI